MTARPLARCPRAGEWLRRGILGVLLTGIAGTLAHAPAGAAPPPAQRLQCALPGGATLAIVHAQGRPLAVAAGVTAGPRECATRSTAPPQADAGGWRFEWRDATLDARYVVQLSALAEGGFRMRLSAPDTTPPGTGTAPGTVPCGALVLPAEAVLRPGDGRCQRSEDRGEALQDAWAALREALLARSPAQLRGVLADKVMLAEGASGDSPRVGADELARHLRCVAALTHRGQRLDDWARAHPHLLTAPTGVDRPDDATVNLTGFGGLQWQGGRWQLTWLAASRAVLLRDCG
jgi:hypothetical protein